MKSIWPRDLTETLIMKYESLPVLWDTSSPYYADKNKRQRAIENISNELQVSESAVKTKIHNLRTQYFHEERKLKLKLSTSDGGNRHDIITWRYFDDLSFISSDKVVQVPSSKVDNSVYLSSEDETLEDNDESPSKIQEFKIKTKRKRQNSYNESIHLKKESSIDTEIDEFRNGLDSPSTSQEQEQQTKKRKKSGTTSNNEDVLFEKVHSAIGTQMDEYQVFGDYIASEFRILKSNKNRMLLRRKIQKAILDIAEIDDIEESYSSS